MCYYATTDYACGDWKWGNMMLRCPRQHRIGETCGAKLVHHESITKSSSICKTCEEMNTKQRRMKKTEENISRWSREPEKFSASLEKAQRERNELEDKIRELYCRRPSVATNMQSAHITPDSSRASSTVASTPTLPPVTSMASSVSPRYEYTSIPATSRSHDGGHYTTPRNGTMPGVSLSGQVSLGSQSTMSQYASLPTGVAVNRSTTTIGGALPYLPVNRQSGGYVVSYARR